MPFTIIQGEQNKEYYVYLNYWKRSRVYLQSAHSGKTTIFKKNIFSSAILASVIDTISLLYRQKDKMASLADVISCLSRGSRSVAAVSVQFPLDFQGRLMLKQKYNKK